MDDFKYCGGVFICNACGRVWHISDYEGFECPQCGIEVRLTEEEDEMPSMLFKNA